MPSRGLRGLWLRSAAAVAACLLALSSTGALVAAAVVAPGSAPAIVLADHGSGDGTSDGKSSGDNNGDSASHTPPAWVSAALAKLIAELDKSKPKPAPAVTHKPALHPTPAAKPATSHHARGLATPAAPVPTAKVVVDSSDPAPFSAQAVFATDAARVLPVERLGPLSGIRFGSGLFIWPLLLAVDVVALAVIARMALRRRLASPED
ncbi:MAG: hypothetical protein JF886_07460 [Candidatus Dormibacteraeota bacterium]|uniref:Uncharacterized protein n=1 Tax=Candidatus Aeolococcus gillhamiae TaxID=3127015 RepID=A0A2W5Z701_9BACT|nr:hypothetical protein [Candidatus Dormibacteraeota bacterium]PZR78526.1 MAG: hypothetical protein DLM65_12800 [Candidatus Dormibacter sp. RRmetagenome_bin12]